MKKGKPFFFAQNYWELLWLHPIIVKTGWPVLSGGESADEFIEANKLPTVNKEMVWDVEEYTKVLSCVIHYGPHQEVIKHFMEKKGEVFLVQRCFDPSLSIPDIFWGMDTNLFTKYLLASEQDMNFLQRHGDKLVLTGSPRLNMAVKALKMPLKDVYDRVGDTKFFVVTVIGGEPIHLDSIMPLYYQELPKRSPIKLVYKMHPSGNLAEYQERYPDLWFWRDSLTDPWDTYKLIAASQGIVTPTSFLAIEATIMKKPVILLGDMHPDELRRQNEQGQRQSERLPKGLSSSLQTPTFTTTQETVRKMWKFDGGSVDRIIKEVLE
jgi:hypothetical protein